METPPAVTRAEEIAEEIGFTLSCEPISGRLLATLTTAVPNNGRILEIGTGTGVGLGWITYGLGDRQDVSVVSIEIDPVRAAAVRRQNWPDCVELIEGSIFDQYMRIGSFDLIFADSGAGKWDGRSETLSALGPGGVLLMDDMTPPQWLFEKHEALNESVRQDLFSRPDLVCVELPVATGILIASKKRNTDHNNSLERTPDRFSQL